MLSLKVSGKLFGKRPDGSEAESAVFSQTFEVEDTLNANFDASAMFGAFMGDELGQLINQMGSPGIEFRVAVTDIEDVTKFEYRVFDQVYLKLDFEGVYGACQDEHQGEIGTVRQVSEDGDFDVEVVFQDGQSCWCANEKVELHRRALPPIAPKPVASQTPVEIPAVKAPQVGDRVVVYQIRPFEDGRNLNVLGTITGVCDGMEGFFIVNTDKPPFADSTATGPWAVELGVDFDTLIPLHLQAPAKASKYS